MHRTILTAFTAVALISGAAAQNQAADATNPQKNVVTPNAPAPVVQTNNVPSPAATATAGASIATDPNAVTQIVYTPKLPTADELRNAANAQGFKVERIVQTGIQVIAFYRDANGRETTVAYQTVPPTGTPAPVAPTVVAPPPTVIYRTAPRVVYYDDYPYYGYSPIWYPPVSLSFGFGFGHGGYYRGGFRHWR